MQVDICPEHVLKHTLSSLQLILRKPGVKKRPFMVRTQADVLTCARHIDSDALAPIFLTSSVTGNRRQHSSSSMRVTTIRLLPGLLINYSSVESFADLLPMLCAGR